MDTIDMDLQDAKILLVDDIPTNLDVLCELLGTQGFKLSVAPNGAVALSIANRMMPHLILLDVMMPGMDGFEVCRRLKQNEKTQSIPVIFITAENMTQSVVTGFEVGGVDYIKKPFQSEEVLVRVQTHLKIDRLTRELTHKNTELSQASERKSRFLANIAHELRTPITSIKGYVDNMLDGIGGKPNERHERYLRRMRDNAVHLQEMINDLLDLSKIEAGHMNVNPELFNVHHLIEACCAEITPLVKPDVMLTHHVSPTSSEAHTDPGRIRQMLINLLSNAAKFTHEGKIDITARIDDGRWTMGKTTTDDGQQTTGKSEGRKQKAEIRKTGRWDGCWRFQCRIRAKACLLMRWKPSLRNFSRSKGLIHNTKAQGWACRLQKALPNCWADR